MDVLDFGFKILNLLGCLVLSVLFFLAVGGVYLIMYKFIHFLAGGGKITSGTVRKG